MQKSGKLIAGVSLVLCLATAVVARAGEGSASLAGSWEGMIVIRPAEYELDLYLDLERTGEGSLRGKISYPTQDVSDYPLESVQVDGEKVAFVVRDEQGVVSAFDGLLSDDRESIQGVLSEQGQSYLFNLHRTSGEHRERSPRPVELLDVAADGRKLRSRFEEDRDKVRLLIILSPTCPMCRNGARLIQHHILDSIKDPNLRVYVVWEAVAPPDTREKALQSAALIADPRVLQLWSPDRFAGKTFQKAVGLEGMPAFDVFLLFDRGREWKESPPVIDSFMHNLPSHPELPQDRRLNGARLAEELSGILARAGKAGKAPAR